jgi:hypothetical protein
MSQQAESATVEQVMGNPQLLDLARRPVMTELILEALPDIEAGKPVDSLTEAKKATLKALGAVEDE